MIPKKIHYCWFGGKELPDLALKCIESWKKHFPDYEIIEWNENNFDLNFNRYAKEAYDSGKYAFFTDVARLYLVYEHGGIYFDVDVEVIKDFDEVLKNKAFFGLESTGKVNTGLGFGAEKHNPFIKKLLDDYTEKKFIQENGDLDLTPCPIINSKIFKENNFSLNGEYENIGGVAVYPKSVFNPKGGYGEEIVLTKKTLSIHHFDGSWLSKEELKRANKFTSLRNKYGAKTAKILFNSIYIPYRLISKLKEKNKK